MAARSRLGKYQATFGEHLIDGRALLTISESDLRKPPLEIRLLGDIKNLMICIRELQWQNVAAVRQLMGPGELVPASAAVQTMSRRNSTRKRRGSSDGTAPSTDVSFEYEDDENSDDGSYSAATAGANSGACKQRRFKPEIWKTVVGMLYFLAVTWITAIVMVIVHDRVPDMQTYPPLPDIFLDNVPHIPWAFAMCEFTGLVLFIVWVSILVCHRHRFILLRRMFSLFGSVFLLRCITMLITSLSVPGKHLQCKARHVGDFSEKIAQAFVIWQGGGMLIQGVRTCGDYMFSGHTTVLTLLNFFITEYTPRSYYFLHTTSWVLNPLRHLLHPVGSRTLLPLTCSSPSTFRPGSSSITTHWRTIGRSCRWTASGRESGFRSFISSSPEWTVLFPTSTTRPSVC
ncbi:hypothetical protein HPB51_003871 [Rhipicephalus microplus]|uniref:SAM domain-containing protein n=1 Tax=Rhipicephalus microplus TaxID=6941 RepID=A0A9J6EL22_RHIMP|nr:hypothetical protein HPB51_003871 [Rhipicephalus microplus]